jgi:hypothetical protein
VNDLLTQFFTRLDQAGKVIWNFLNPQQPLSWRTLILISLFSWTLVLVAGPSPIPVLGGLDDDGDLVSLSPLQNALFIIGWVFLNLGIGWWFAIDSKKDKKAKIKIPFLELEFYPGAWITAGITCLFLFRLWNPGWREVALVSWPIVTAVYAAVPKLLSPVRERKLPKPEDRQALTILALKYTLLSCWFAFYFLIQSWLTNYPPILASTSGLRGSMFIVKLSPDQSAMLDSAESVLRARVNELPLPEVRSQLQNPDFISEIESQVMQGLSPSQQALNLELQIFNLVVDGEGPVRLWALWSDDDERRSSYLEKVCQLQIQRLDPGEPSASADRPSIIRLQCGSPNLKIPSPSPQNT